MNAMAVLKVRKYGDPVLRRRATPVREITPEIRRTVEDMIETMYDEVGIGLAAPQVGVSLRLMVVGHDNGRDARAIVNPVITEQGGEITSEEGCLSLPGIFAPVTRAEWVRLEGQDLEGQPVSIKARGLVARVFQHEMDHLDGVLFIDRLDPMTRDRIKRRIKKEGFPAESNKALAL
jgi:peptide deformylase